MNAATHPTIQAMRPFLTEEALANPERVLVALIHAGQEHPHRPGILLVPSHVTPVQAERILERPRSTIGYQMRKGGPLQSESWWGQTLIPMSLVAAQLKRKEP